MWYDSSPHALKEDMVEGRVAFRLIAISKIMDQSLPVGNFLCNSVGILNNCRLSVFAQGILFEVGLGQDNEKLQTGQENIVRIHLSQVRSRSTKSKHSCLDLY